MRKLLAFLGVLGVLWTAPAQAQNKPLYMLDFVFMNSGYSLKDRDSHQKNAVPIAARHGIKLVASLDTRILFQGPENMSRLDLWTLPNQSAIGAWGADPDFKKIEPNSLKIHNTDRLSLYFARKVAISHIISGNTYFVELLTFDMKNFTAPEFIDYMKKNDAVAKNYGLTRVASFNPLSKFFGPGPKANWLNIYLVRSEKELRNWTKDDKYQALIPIRSKLLEGKKSLIGLFQAN